MIYAYIVTIMKYPLLVEKTKKLFQWDDPEVATPRHVFQMDFWRHKPNVRSIFHRHLSNCRDGLGEASLRLKSKKKTAIMTSWTLESWPFPTFSASKIFLPWGHQGVPYGPVPGTLDIWINFNAEICGAEVCCITAPGTSTEPTDWMTPPARAETLPGPNKGRNGAPLEPKKNRRN